MYSELHFGQCGNDMWISSKVSRAKAPFSALLYWRGEQVAQGIRHFATRLAGVRGDAAVLLAAQAIRAVALPRLT